MRFPNQNGCKDLRPVKVNDRFLNSKQGSLVDLPDGQEGEVLMTNGISIGWHQLSPESTLTISDKKAILFR